MGLVLKLGQLPARFNLALPPQQQQPNGDIGLYYLPSIGRMTCVRHLFPFVVTHSNSNWFRPWGMVSHVSEESPTREFKPKTTAAVRGTVLKCT